MATAKPKVPKDSMAKEEALLASAKYGGNKQTGGMNNILQKRLNKGQKYFDSGDYNMAKAKTPVPKGVQPDTPADAAPAEPQQVEQAQPTIEEHPQTAPADEVKDAGSSKLAEADNATKLSAEPTAKASSDEPQRGYPRKVIPTASPLAKPTALTAQADSTATSTFTITTTTTSAVGAGAGGPIPQPRALAAHLTHATHSGPFVTHPERPSPSAESPPPDGDTEAGPHADCPECCN